MERIGSWVVVKPTIHRPWWSKEKVKVQFLYLPNLRHRQRLQKLLARTDIIVEEFITDVEDRFRCFGELRVFSTAYT
jgi:hypothetical protein